MSGATDKVAGGEPGAAPPLPPLSSAAARSAILAATANRSGGLKMLDRLRSMLDDPEQAARMAEQLRKMLHED